MIFDFEHVILALVNLDVWANVMRIGLGSCGIKVIGVGLLIASCAASAVCVAEGEAMLANGWRTSMNGCCLAALRCICFTVLVYTAITSFGR